MKADGMAVAAWLESWRRHVPSGMSAGLRRIPYPFLHWLLRILFLFVIAWPIVEPWLAREVEIPVASIRDYGGRAVMVTVRPLQQLPLRTFYDRKPDTNESPSRSTLVIKENGRALPLPHSVHRTITEQGGGRYSHWSDAVIFSATDESDPRSNGRTYSVRWSMDSFRVLVLPVMLLGLLLLFGQPNGLPEVRMARRLLTKRAEYPVLLVRAALALPVLVAIIWFTGAFDRRVDVPISAIVPLPEVYGVHVRTVDPGGWGGIFYSHAGDTDTFGPSALSLRENGKPLLAAHTDLATIQKLGRGRYGHIGGWLYLSASDNSDPRSNGRTYSLDWSASLARVLVPPLLLLGAALLWFRRSLHLLPWVGGTLALLGKPQVAISAVGAVLIANNLQAQEGLLEGLRLATKEFMVAGLALGIAVVLFRGLTGWWALLHSLLAAAALTLLVVTLSPLWMYWLVFAFVAVGCVLALGGSHLLDASIAQTEAHLTRRNVTICLIVLTAIVSVPELARYWDQSGWMDSSSYDECAHAIANGRKPAGCGIFMPLYQYGMAALYWVFGHFFFVQQIANLIMALVGTLAFAAAAYKLYQNVWAAVVAGVFVILWPFHRPVYYPQIESWYIPLFAVSLLALTHYRLMRSAAAVVLLAIAASAIFNMRLQGAFYAAALGLAPFIVPQLDWRGRLKHAVAFGVIFLFLGIAPWTARNYAVEGRLSPSSEQADSFNAILNDPRVPLYGIRYTDNFATVAPEWVQRYPDLTERLAAQRKFFRDRLLNDLGWFFEAFPYRLMAFYGLLPGGYLHPDGIRAPESFFAGVREIAVLRIEFWVPIAFSILGLLAAGVSPFTWFLALLILSNVIICFLVGFAEPRLSFPVFLLHALIGLAVISPLRRPGDAVLVMRHLRPPAARALLIAAGLVAAAIVLHLYVGRPFAFRSIMADSWKFETQVRPDPGVPYLRVSAGKLLLDGKPVEALEPGARFTVHLGISNNMLPPRYFTGTAEVPIGLRRDNAVQYFYAYPDGAAWPFAARYSGTQALTPAREGELVLAQARIDQKTNFMGIPMYWVLIEKIIPRPKQ